MFCLECGNTEKKMIGDLCIDCYLKNFHMIDVPKRIDVSICSHCNSKLEKGQWIDTYIPDDEIIYRALENNIKVSDEVTDEIIDLNILQMRGTIAECNIIAIAYLSGVKIQEEYEVEVKLNRTVCPTCSKEQSGYYEAVIQFRADKREVTPDEFKIADETVKKTLNRLYKKDKLAYLVQIAKLKEGHDYYIGSYKSSKKVIKQLQDLFGGTTKESPRLISEDKSTGKGLYRIWISLRIPEFKKGDFIKYLDTIYNVKSITSSKINCIDLKTKKPLAINFKDYDLIELVKSKKDIIKVNIISKTPTTIQILDPDTYETVDFEKNDDSLNIGDEIDIIKTHNEIYLV